MKDLLGRGSDQDHDYFILAEGCINLPTVSGRESWELIKPFLWPVYNALMEVLEEQEELDFSTFADVFIVSLMSTMDEIEVANMKLVFKSDP